MRSVWNVFELIYSVEVYGFESELNSRSTFLSRALTNRWFGLLVRLASSAC
jgi:hypothetical protein